MVRYGDLGFSSFEDFFYEFKNTLLMSNKTYDYFVDWDKVRREIEAHRAELSILNVLTRINSKDERTSELGHLISKYPEVVSTLPLLIAERIHNEKIDIFDLDSEEVVSLVFTPDAVEENSLEEIVDFCVKTGIIDLFGEIKDVIDYLLGVEVGLDTNARKNRSGNIFDKIVERRITKFIDDSCILVGQDPNLSLYKVIASGKKRAKTHDYVIYREGKPAVVIECNFYNTAGSKPISIAESYILMSQAAGKRGLKFVWITDGPAWLKMTEPLERAMSDIDWVINYYMINKIMRIIEST